MERSLAVVSDVKDLSELLNGASVEHAELVPSGGTMHLVLALTRAMVERQEVVRRGPFRRLKTPWTKCQLRLSHIQAITVRRLADQAPDHAPLMACDAVPGGYQVTVQAPDGLQLVLRIDRLEGAFTDVGSPITAP